MKRNAKRVAVLAAAVGGLGFIFTNGQSAKASLLSTLYPSLPVDTIYSDNFTGGTAGSPIANNVPTVASGLDGGFAGTTWIGPATANPTKTAPDAVWNYSASGASIVSPSANIDTGANAGEDSATIANLALPFVAAVGFTYDLEATFMAPTITGTSGAHGLEMAYLFNNGNGHLNSAGQAISNNDPVGLILDRDHVNPTNTGATTFFDIFEGSGTAGDTAFGPSTSPNTGGAVGSTITVDVLYTPTSSTGGNMQWYINGNLVNSTPFAASGLTGGITDIQLGDNRITGGLIQNFSLTAVPEPTVAALLLTTTVPLMLRRNRKRS